MSKKTVLKVDINCLKCQTKVLKAAAKLSGITAVAVDLAKGTVTVTGDVDPVLVTKQIRKIGKFVEVVSVGPAKPDPPKPPPQPLFPVRCDKCRLVPIYEYGSPRLCTIL